MIVERDNVTGVDLVGFNPGFLIHAIEINNPTGSWLLVAKQMYLPPYTFQWVQGFHSGLSSVSVLFTNGPSGQASSLVGGPVIVRVYDYERKSSQLNTYGVPH